MKLRKRIMAMALGILGSVTVLGTAAYAANETQTPKEAAIEADTAAESSAVEESSTVAEETSGTALNEQSEDGGNDEEKKPVVYQHDAKLTVNAFEDLEEKKTPVEKDGKGVHLSLYKIASIGEDGSYILDEKFGKALSSAGFEIITADNITETGKNAEIRKAVSDYLSAEGSGTKASYSGDTENGTTTFEIPAKELGLYYLQGDIIEGYFEGDVDGKTGSLSYIPSTSLVSLPSPPNDEIKTDYLLSLNRSRKKRKRQTMRQ